MSYLHTCTYNCVHTCIDLKIRHLFVKDILECMCILQKKLDHVLLAYIFWQFINIWTGNTLMVCCKLSLSSDMLVKAYSKP